MKVSRIRPGEEREIRVALHQRLRVQHDQPVEVVARDARRGSNGAAPARARLVERRGRARSRRTRSARADPPRPSRCSAPVGRAPGSARAGGACCCESPLRHAASPARRGRRCSARRPACCPASTSSSWTMSCTVSIGTYASAERARPLADPRRRARVAGSGSACSDRNALRIAISILRVFQATTSPERRISRGAPVAAARRRPAARSGASRAPWRPRTAPCSISAASTSAERSASVTGAPTRRAAAGDATAPRRGRATNVARRGGCRRHVARRAATASVRERVGDPARTAS